MLVAALWLFTLALTVVVGVLWLKVETLNNRQGYNELIVGAMKRETKENDTKIS